MKYIIDRFEGEYAVIELSDRKTVNIPKIILPENAFEGSIINITVDETETLKIKEKMRSRLDGLFKN